MLLLVAVGVEVAVVLVVVGGGRSRVGNLVAGRGASLGKVEVARVGGSGRKGRQGSWLLLVVVATKPPRHVQRAQLRV